MFALALHVADVERHRLVARPGVPVRYRFAPAPFTWTRRLAFERLIWQLRRHKLPQFDCTPLRVRR